MLIFMEIYTPTCQGSKKDTSCKAKYWQHWHGQISVCVCVCVCVSLSLSLSLSILEITQAKMISGLLMRLLQLKMVHYVSWITARTNYQSIISITVNQRVCHLDTLSLKLYLCMIEASTRNCVNMPYFIGV